MDEQPVQESDAVFISTSDANRYCINLARFDLVSVRLAVLCADMGSLSAAVKRLHCSLSTGSYRLSMLEDALGTQLFMRDHRGLHLTDTGSLLVHHCRAILVHVELMSQHVAPDLRPVEDLVRRPKVEVPLDMKLQ
ncbi:LysR family transcriptional regulator [Hydrogenophaga sp. 2FB]|uniref:LysR family transcriptional regulator n=1 Tax=Hydrogenophaga sp. 2FB TaxID=2502187 RepID=UPI001484EAC5|nr:LysR family transcriptional regulator [Hydrogenophaga sp. 2FB]